MSGKLYAGSELCRICLSFNRKLTPIKPFMFLLLKSCGLDYSMEESICWECCSLLLKFAKFKQKALEGQELLKNFYKFQTEISSLSTLNITKCNIVYDMTYKEPMVEVSVTELNVLEHNDEEPKEFEVKLETDLIYDDDFDYNDFLKEETGDDTASKEHKTNTNSDYDNLEVKFDFNEETVAKEKRVKSKQSVNLELGEVNSNEESVKIKQKTKRKNLKTDSEETISGRKRIKTVCKFKFENEFEDTDKDEPAVTTKDRPVKYVLKELSKEEMLQLRNNKLNNLNKGNVQFVCEKCIVGFQTDVKLNEHINSVHVKNNEIEELCTICECYIHVAKLEGHMSMHYVAYQCPVCDFISITKALARKHFDSQHFGSSSMLPCHLCKKKFRDQISLLRHRSKAHKPVECQVCGKQLRDNRSLKQHMLLHTGQILHQCPICQNYYRGRSGLRIHLQGVHQRSKPENAYCAECDVHYRSVHTYKQHLRESTRHTGANQRYRCDLCEKAFISKQYLRTHIGLIHTKISKYTCHLCEGKFPGPKKLQEHIDFVHNKLPKPKRFECNICHRKFSLKHVLKNHMNYHTGERPYKCVLCDATFSQNGALYKHRQLVHKIKKLTQ